MANATKSATTKFVGCLAFSPHCQFRPLADLPLMPGWFASWLICPWLVRPLSHSPPGLFALWRSVLLSVRIWVNLNYRSVGNNCCFCNSKTAANVRKNTIMKNLPAGQWRFPSFFICCLFSICNSSMEIFPATDVLFNFTRICTDKWLISRLLSVRIRTV